MIVRARHFAFDAPGMASAMARLYYPADPDRIDEARLTGAVPPIAGTRSVVVFMPGVNVSPDDYGWLAEAVVEAGCVGVTYAGIGDLGPAGQGITPGMDMASMAPDVIGTRCSAPAIGPLLEAVAAVGSDVADMSSIWLVGHSAGGTVALHNTNPNWIHGLRGVVAYGAHTMTATMLGHGEATVVPVASKVPVLLLAGSDDAVIAASRDRYRTDDAEHDPVKRTFDEAISRNDGDSWLVELADGNHFTMCHPVDMTSGRAFLEPDLRPDDMDTRHLLAEIICDFVTGQSLDKYAGSDRVSTFRKR